MPWIVAGGAVAGGLLGSSSAKKAASAQQQAAAEATGEQRRQFDITRRDNLPWLQTGQAGIKKISDLLGLSAGPTSKFGFSTNPRLELEVERLMAERGHSRDEAVQMVAAGWGATPDRIEVPGSQGSGELMRDFTGADLQNEPGYKFALAEGNKAIENAARARGVSMSPMTVKELLRYGTDYAGTKYNDAFNRDMAQKNAKFGFLLGTGNAGQNAALSTSNTGMNTANTIGQLMTGGANARGAATIAGGNAIGGAISNIGNWYQQNQNRQQQQDFLKKLLQPNGGNHFNDYSGGVWR